MQVRSSAGGEWQSWLWSHLLFSHIASSLLSLHLRPSLCGRQTLSLIFYFSFQCVPEDEQNVQITPCDHRLIYESCFWDTHASYGFLWCCLEHRRHVLSGLSKSQPSARASVAHSLPHLSSKSSGEYVQRCKMPLPHRYYHITYPVFTRFSRRMLSWPKVLAASF